MKIAIDAMGGDHAPAATVKGILEAAQEWPELKFILVGDSRHIQKYFPEQKTGGDVIRRIDILEASEMITNDEEPVKAVRKKKDSSLVRSVELVKQGEADAVISAGNTGAFMTAGLLGLGRIKGIDRPALAPIIPTIDGRGTLILDVGANMDARPQHLLQYAVMGSIYAGKVMGIDQPRVGLLNVGAEGGKGNELTKEAYGRLQELPIHFIGNVEAREVPYGSCDVLVCDGFTGNILLKSLEGMAAGVFEVLKTELTRNILSKLAASMLRPAFRRIKNRMDYAEYGGAPLMGLQGVCIKAHGSSDARAIKNAVTQTKKFIEHGVIDQISREIKKVSDENGE